MADIEKYVFSNTCDRKTLKFVKIFMVERLWFLKSADWPWDVCSSFWRCFFWALQQLSSKRTAKENEKKYGAETACTLRENFYVYDL